MNPNMAFLEGARNIELEDLSHIDMVMSEDVFPHVLGALQGNGLNNGSVFSETPSPPTGLRVISSTGF